ncbi:uncharacterized protein LOC113021315 isoform X2 [Astatotilapia calliptera]|uniref:uncharacterized protein LOC113021315 isoform X2 n=1 Tax=Astatotilapia calliptera TaxID=8154 RepID=UPI000E4088A0|nr:uncharacterized protein LOC113021315 isoform X2 [Astatotilapia calliptera]
MEFSLDDFVTSPSWDKIVKCRKADLLIIASCYDIQVSYGDRKVEVRDALCAELVERGILPAPKAAVEQPDGGGVKVAPEAEPGPDAKGPVNVLPAEADSDSAEAGSDAAEADSDAAGANIEAAGSGTAGEPLAGRSTEDLRLTLRIREVETRAKELEVQAMHLRVRALELERKPSTSASSHPSTSTAVPTGFDITRHVKLVPPFREAEVDSYFNAFERIAAALSWPKEFWPLLLQCKLVGKAQEVCTSLSIEDSLDYDIMKKTVLQAYELVPEAYRQRFRKCEKTANQTFVEFGSWSGWAPAGLRQRLLLL